jgi:hypothetical protein
LSWQVCFLKNELKNDWEIIMSTEIGGLVDKGLEQRIQDSFDRQGLMAHLGASVTEIR